MASIVHKVVGGQTYYYLREMARVSGKPKMVSQRYLGKATDIEAAMDGAMAVPERTRHLAFGDLAASDRRATDGCGCRPQRWITAASGTPCTPSTPTPSSRSN